MRHVYLLAALALLLVSTGLVGGQSGYEFQLYNSPYCYGNAYYPGPCFNSELPEELYDPCDPAMRGPEAVKIAALKECPVSTIWGYDYPYSMAYTAGAPRYVGHNYGAPSGQIYEFPALYPNGVPEPAIYYGDPEYAMLLNYGYSFPFHGPVYSSIF